MSTFTFEILCLATITYERVFILFAAPRFGDHLVKMYRLCLMRAIKLQFTIGLLAMGYSGACELARKIDLNKALIGINMSENELSQPELQPVILENIEKVLARDCYRDEVTQS